MYKRNDSIKHNRSSEMKKNESVEISGHLFIKTDPHPDTGHKWFMVSGRVLEWLNSLGQHAGKIAMPIHEYIKMEETNHNPASRPDIKTVLWTRHKVIDSGASYFIWSFGNGQSPPTEEIMGKLL